MNMEKKLPINLNIVYSGMLRDRNRLIAILTNKQMKFWYNENFIPLIMYPNGNIHCYDTTNYYEIFNIYDQVIDLKMINKISIDMVRQEIDDNRYIIAYFDHYYLMGSKFFNNTHKFQEVLIYGYSDKEQSFFFHGNQIGKKDYGCGECSYLKFLEGTKNSFAKVNEDESLMWRILFGHPISSFAVKDNKPDINIRKIFFHFENLLNGGLITIQKNDKIETYATGISIFKRMVQHFSVIGENDKMSYERSIWCVKLLAEYVLNYKDLLDMLSLHFGLRFDGEVFEKIDIVCKQILSVYALLQKYFITDKLNNVIRTIQLLNDVEDQMRSIWNQIYISLRSYLFNEEKC